MSKLKAQTKAKCQSSKDKQRPNAKGQMKSRCQNPNDEQMTNARMPNLLLGFSIAIRVRGIKEGYRHGVHNSPVPSYLKRGIRLFAERLR
jgi:hypothetical protein